MKALVYNGANKLQLNDKPKPTIKNASDAIIRVTKTTICGTDLHIGKGDVATCAPGTVLGHEGVGIIEEIGASVANFKKGDKVLISCISACGTCEYCKRLMPSHCTTGGWILGNTIDGTQAEYVRIPHADSSLYAIPKGANESSYLMLSDIFPTGFECGVLRGKVAPGSTVCIVGGGPVGLAALITAQLYSPALIIMVDLDDNRLQVATKFGAEYTINSGTENVQARVHELTGGKGCDTVIEAVGVAATFELCQEVVAPGGNIANVGVHGAKVDLHLEKLWDQNVSITTQLVDAVTTPMLLKLVNSGKIDPSALITHTFAFKDIEGAYDTFGAAAKNHALKVLIEM
jgi:alcohol dehydrogenase